MVEPSQVPAQIPERTVQVYKSCIDTAVLKLTVEKLKYTLFAKEHQHFNPAEVQVVSVDKHYEPYLLIDAKYYIEYNGMRLVTLDIEPGVKTVEILTHSFTPNKRVSPTGETIQTVQLEVEERYSYVDYERLMLDKTGREIVQDPLLTALLEEHPERILRKARKRLDPLDFSESHGVETVKARIVKRPPNVENIEQEEFHITQHAVTYVPVYRITLRDLCTSEQKTAQMNGITAQILV